jgi:hypothetical protein
MRESWESVVPLDGTCPATHPPVAHVGSPINSCAPNRLPPSPLSQPRRLAAAQHPYAEFSTLRFTLWIKFKQLLVNFSWIVGIGVLRQWQ